MTLDIHIKTESDGRVKVLFVRDGYQGYMRLDMEDGQEPEMHHALSAAMQYYPSFEADFFSWWEHQQKAGVAK
jgi:hypothetical protein